MSEYEDSVRLYLDEIGRYPLLTKDDETRLAREIEAGKAARASLASSDAPLAVGERRRLERAVRQGEHAWSTFVQSNLRLVVMVAKRYQASGLPLLDLIQEGNLGLMHAVDKFDWRKGFKFSTYATWWIRQAVQRGAANSARVIRLPAQADEELSRLRQARATAQEAGTDLSKESLARATGLSPARIDALTPYLFDPRGLDAPVDDKGETELGDLVADRSVLGTEDAALGALVPDAMQRALGLLDPVEREVLTFLYGLDGGEPQMPLDVGALVQLTGDQVRAIETRALSRLRDRATSTGLEDLLAA
jgi:RNA polymerase sigma factor (sigma-70 family)